MLSILSPAKTLDFDPAPPNTVASKAKSTKPVFIDQAAELIENLRNYSVNQVGDLMGISAKLAQLNHDRFHDWESPHPKQGSKQALFAFQGDVYRGLQADKMTPTQIEYCQDHVRILSGLYGILRPLDRILPYRLEMGTGLTNDRGDDLYEFWEDRICVAINKQLKKTDAKFLLNLASNEYSKAAQLKQIDQPIIAPAFKEYKNGKYKMISFYAKTARGTMAAWVVKNKVKTIARLKRFSEDGYRYDADSSTDSVPVFLRGGE